LGFFLANLFLHFHLVNLLLSLDILTSFFTLKQALLQGGQLILLLLENSLSFLLDFSLLFFDKPLFDSLLLQIEFILGKIPVQLSLVDFFSWFGICNNNHKHVIRSKSNSIEMENLGSFG
jgi:hypothetical protein